MTSSCYDDFAVWQQTLFSVSAAVFIFIKNSQQQQQKHKRQEVHADLHSYFAGFRRGHEEPVQQRIL